MDKIKESFEKVKGDINSLYSEMNSIRGEFENLRKEMIELCQVLENINNKIEKNASDYSSTHKSQNPTPSTHPSTHNLPLESSKPQNMGISIGNEGVPTDKQTNRQTDRQQPLSKDFNSSFNDFEANIQPKTPLFTNFTPPNPSSIENAAQILDSLDSIKKELRLKFKRLTEQEMLVFSTLYQLEEESLEGGVNYKTIAKKLNLTESSIRDYIGRLMKKGIPLDKKKINNKNISLSISESLKMIASLPTISKLRDL